MPPFWLLLFVSAELILDLPEGDWGVKGEQLAIKVGFFPSLAMGGQSGREWGDPQCPGSPFRGL